MSECTFAVGPYRGDGVSMTVNVNRDNTANLKLDPKGSNKKFVSVIFIDNLTTYEPKTLIIYGPQNSKKYSFSAELSGNGIWQYVVYSMNGEKASELDCHLKSVNGEKV